MEVMAIATELSASFHHDVIFRDADPQGGFDHAKFVNKLFGSITKAKTDAGFTVYSHTGVVSMDAATLETLKLEVQQVVSESMGDLDPASNEANRIYEMSPHVLEAVMESPYISGVSERYLVDLARWSVEAARNPQLIGKTAIRVGFGGSDDEHLSMRYPSYLLPAVDIWNRLANLRDQRLAQFENAKAKYIRDSEFGDIIEAEQDKQRKKELRVRYFNEARAMVDEYGFEPETIESLRLSAGIFDLPRIELIFAFHAGIAINGKDKGKTIAQAAQGMQLAQAFIGHFFPELSSYIDIRSDGEPGPYTELITGYLSELVHDAYAKPQYASLRDGLVNLAVNHGKANGATSMEEAPPDAATEEAVERSEEYRKAVEYAAKHVLFFQDQVNIPSVSRIGSTDEAWANISIGGRPERLFNEIRQVISETATADGFVQYTQRQFDAGTVSEIMVERVLQWRDAYGNRASGYEQGTLNNHWARADIPFITMPLMTDIGRCPVYYVKKFDAVLDESIIEGARRNGLLGVVDSLYDQRNDRSLRDRSWYESIRRDFETLVGSVNEEELLNFYDQFIRTHQQ